MEKFRPEGADWAQKHLAAYLRTDGATGHLVDFSALGGPPEAPCLVLKATGRKSGTPKLTPLIYGRDGKTFVVIASKGGAPDHPAWFLNLAQDPHVEFQVGAAKYRGMARVAESPERERLYEMMTKICPPYAAYATMTDRKIPVIVLEPEVAIADL